jgi:hypothetical protein
MFMLELSNMTHVSDVAPEPLGFDWKIKENKHQTITGSSQNKEYNVSIHLHALRCWQIILLLSKFCVFQALMW